MAGTAIAPPSAGHDPPPVASFLPRPLQLAAQRRYQLMSLLNPLGANLTIGPVIALLALQYGASDMQMGLLYASVYLTGVCAVLAPALFAGVDATRLTAGSWWARAVAGGLLLILPLVAAEARTWVLLGVVYAFFSIRAVGLAALPSVIRAISSARELPTVNAGGHLRWHLGCLATSLLAWAVLSLRGTIGDQPAFMLLLAVGLVFNLAASWSMSTLPDTGQIERGSWRALADGAATVWRTRGYREVVLATALQVPMAVASSFQLNHLKNGLGLGPDTITALTVAGIVVAVAGSHAMVRIGARIPIRPLLVGSHIGLALVGAGWTWLDALPPAWRTAAGATLFVASTLFLALSGLLLASLANERLPERNAVSVSVMYQLTGVAAALAAIIAIPWLGSALPWETWPGMHRYSHAFALWTALSLGVCALGLAMANGRLDALAADLDQLRPANLLTVFRAHQLQVHAASNPGQVRELEDVLTTQVPATVELLLESLASPEARNRAAAYRALFERPLERALPLMVAEASCPDSPLRSEAITALGFLRTPGALAALRTFSQDPDPAMAASAWKGLLRHGDAVDAAVLMACWRACRPWPRSRLDLTYGLHEARRTDLLLAGLGEELGWGTDPIFQRTILVSLAESLGDDERMAELLAREQRDPAGALDELLGELPDPVAGASHAAWRQALGGDGRAVLPAGATLPGGLAPTGGASLVGLLHLQRLGAAQA